MATGQKKRFVELGMAVPLAIELAAQITASAGNKRRLVELGMPEIQANIVVASVVSHTVNKNRLAEASMTPRLVREFAAQIAS